MRIPFRRRASGKQHSRRRIGHRHRPPALHACEVLETRILLAVNPIRVQDLVAVGDLAYFYAETRSDDRRGLWVSDGTAEGTRELISFGSAYQSYGSYSYSGQPRGVTVEPLGDLVVFSYQRGLHETSGRQLGVSDGTPEGTRLLDDIPALEHAWFERGSNELIRFGDAVYFAADDGVHGLELWKTDGTADGTVLVRDVVPGSQSSHVGSFAVLGDHLYFSAKGQTLDGLWRTDGTDDGTVRVASMTYPTHTTAAGDALYFESKVHNSPRVWSYDGNEVMQLIEGGLAKTEQNPVLEVGGAVYLSAAWPPGHMSTRLWRTDGTPQGTFLVQGDDPELVAYDPAHLTDFNGQLVFYAGGVNGRTLWTSDGTPEGTFPLDSYFAENPGQDPAHLGGYNIVTEPASYRPVVFDDVLYYGASNQEIGASLARTNGTREGTDIAVTFGEYPYHGLRSLAALDDFLLLVSSESDNGWVLSRSDGTAEGTTRLFDPKGNATPGLFDPTDNGLFLSNYYRRGASDFMATLAGAPDGGLIPLSGDFFGHFRDSVALYDPATSTFYWGEGECSLTHSVQFGPAGAGWHPVAGDWDGDGIDTFGLYEPNNGLFFLRNSHTPGSADAIFSYGPPGSGWTPITGDWNASGSDGVGLYEPISSTFYIREALAPGLADVVVQYGSTDSGWVPIAGDWNGDGRDTMGLFAPQQSIFYVRNSLDAGPASYTSQFGPENGGLLPVVGDWNGLTHLPQLSVYTASTTTLGVTAILPHFDLTTFNYHIAGDHLRAEDYHVSRRAGVEELTQDELTTIVDAAIARWAATGLDAALVAQLQSVEMRVTDLSTNLLALSGSEYPVDHDAAGHGWFVDPTPLEDEEFEWIDGHLHQATDPLAGNRYDLLSAVMYQLGVELGLESAEGDDDVMSMTLTKGARRLPDASLIDRLLAGDEED